jgi:CRP-like cAMP-binding protein
LSGSKSESKPAVFRKSEAEALLQAGQSRTVAARTALCQEGKLTDRFFFVVAGKVEISKSIAGTCRALTTFGPGSVLVLMAALDGSPCAVSIRALTDVTVVEITRGNFLAMLEQERPNEANLVHELTLVAIRRLRDATVELGQTLHRSLRASPRVGRMDPLSLALIHAGNHAWAFTRLAA